MCVKVGVRGEGCRCVCGMGMRGAGVCMTGVRGTGGCVTSVRVGHKMCV